MWFVSSRHYAAGRDDEKMPGETATARAHGGGSTTGSDQSTTFNHNTIVYPYRFVMYTTSSYCTGALYTFSDAVSTNQSRARSPSARRAAHGVEPAAVGAADSGEVLCLVSGGSPSWYSPTINPRLLS